MAFYDFCRCVRLEKTSTSRTKNTAGTRLGVRLIEHTNEVRGEGSEILVPRVMGMSFDIDNPLLRSGQNVDDAYEGVNFTDRHQQILNNWEAIHECQDERDAERMRKRAEQSQESRAMTRALHGVIETETEIDLNGVRQNKIRDVRGEAIIVAATDEFEYPNPTSSQLKAWASSIKEQENQFPPT